MKKIFEVLDDKGKVKDDERIVINYGFFGTSGKYQILSGRRKWLTKVKVRSIKKDIRALPEEVVKHAYHQRFINATAPIKKIELVSGNFQDRLHPNPVHTEGLIVSEET